MIVPAMIEAEGLTRYFGSFVAVEGVSFSIPKGQIVAFLGPNGAGKSTTMRMLSGFLAPSAGNGKIGGLDMNTQRLEAARRLGYLPENGPLYDEMTPMELLRYFADVRELPEGERRRRTDAVVEMCALGDVREKPIGKLSKGYRQRVGLAQALLHDPDVLIMDEPTAGLDPNQIHDFRSNITTLGREKTIMISTHILQEVEAVAQRVLLINEGRLVFDGTPAELRSGGSLEEAFHSLTGRKEASSSTDRGESA